MKTIEINWIKRLHDFLIHKQLFVDFLEFSIYFNHDLIYNSAKNYSLLSQKILI